MPVGETPDQTDKHRLIRDIYCVDQSEEKMNIILDRLASNINSNLVILGYNDLSSGHSWNLGSQSYRNIITEKLDIWMEHCNSCQEFYDFCGPRAEVMGSEIFHGPEAFIRTQRERDLLQKCYDDVAQIFGLSHFFGGAFSSKTPRIGFVGLGFSSEREDAARCATTEQSFWLTHLSGATNLGRRIQEVQRITEAQQRALDALNWGILVVDSRRQVIASNTASAAIIEALPQLAIRNGKLEVGRDIASRLTHVMQPTASLRSRRCFSLAVGGENDPDRFVIFCTAFTNREKHFVDATEGLILFLLDRSRCTRACLDLAQTVFSMSTAETSVLSLFMEGLTRNEAAEARGVSPETIKSQIGSVLGKTQSRTVSEAIVKVADLEPPATSDV